MHDAPKAEEEALSEATDHSRLDIAFLSPIKGIGRVIIMFDGSNPLKDNGF